MCTGKNKQEKTKDAYITSRVTLSEIRANSNQNHTKQKRSYLIIGKQYNLFVIEQLLIQFHESKVEWISFQQCIP